MSFADQEARYERAMIEEPLQERIKELEQQLSEGVAKLTKQWEDKVKELETHYAELLAHERRRANAATTLNSNQKQMLDSPTTEYLCEHLIKQLEVADQEMFEKNFHRNADGKILCSVFAIVGPLAEELTGMVREWANTKGMKRTS